jgi:hypothetical protein
MRFAKWLFDFNTGMGSVPLPGGIAFLSPNFFSVLAKCLKSKELQKDPLPISHQFSVVYAAEPVAHQVNWRRLCQAVRLQAIPAHSRRRTKPIGIEQGRAHHAPGFTLYPFT